MSFSILHSHTYCLWGSHIQCKWESMPKLNAYKLLVDLCVVNRNMYARIFSCRYITKKNTIRTESFTLKNKRVNQHLKGPRSDSVFIVLHLPYYLAGANSLECYIQLDKGWIQHFKNAVTPRPSSSVDLHFYF